ncbi:MAG TPA: hypothetical protein VGL34_24820 [Steroidobacteraceae bacterium]|jgi:hypothetical protein
MSTLPRVAESTREQITREFDDLGPEACVAEISAHLRDNNPEWLYMAAKCARDVGDPQRVMNGFCMLYRLLIAQAAPSHRLTTESGALAGLDPLPRVTVATRAAIVAEIDQSGAETFIQDALQELQSGNPELLQMAHFFASAHENYLGVMQGFALLYTALLIQSGADRLTVH